ncbi:MAG: peptide-methionine (S)-S-oxide reductase MsrA [Burkholderiales bacterium]|nr:peptide-methionine (S)-S-oxide reductase MsrA [Burkholderiales bacterium]
MATHINTPGIEIAIVGGGCFWCLEAVFQQIRGVVKVESGYAGGSLPDPSYEQVCGGKTGHAEVIRLSFDTAVISYRELLEIFFTLHDPTTLNRQGNDVGTQYRSVIFFDGEQQKKIAHEVMAAMAAVWDAPIVTELAAAPQFYVAEDYHQNYFRLHDQQAYCALVVAPKVAHARQLFADKIVGM